MLIQIFDRTGTVVATFNEENIVAADNAAKKWAEDRGLFIVERYRYYDGCKYWAE